MKTIIIFLFTLLSFKSQSQLRTLICGDILSKENFTIQFYEPINGFQNCDFIDTNSIINSGYNSETKKIYKQIDIQKPIFISIAFLDDKNSFTNITEMLLTPGDSIHIVFDLNIDKSSWVKFSGSNAKGHQLFNEINYNRIEKYKGTFTILDEFMLHKNETKFIAQIDSCVNIYKGKFNLLYVENSISEKYRKYLNLNFMLLLYENVCNKLIRFSKANNRIPLVKRRYILEKLFEKLSPLNDDIKGLFLSDLYTGTYYEYEACKEANVEYVDELTDVDKTINIEGKDLTINKYLIPYTYIKDKKAQADFWALNMLSIFSCYRGALDESAITQYLEIFPNNKWEKYLRIQYEKFKKKENVEYKLQSPITFIDSTQKSSDLNELLKLLPKNKPVFIDMWATWCGPCKDAFSYNQQLDSLLIALNFEKLYISIDNEQNKATWVENIDKYKLGGYHYLANENLINDIKKITGTEKEYGMRVPRYIIINKYGIVINNDAISPNNFDLLTTQLKDASIY